MYYRNIYTGLIVYHIDFYIYRDIYLIYVSGFIYRRVASIHLYIYRVTGDTPCLGFCAVAWRKFWFFGKTLPKGNPA